MEEIDVRIQDVFTILKNRWKIILGVTFIITLIVTIMSFYVITPVFQVSAKVFIGKEETADPNYNNNDVQMYQKLIKTYSEFMKTNDLIENAIYKNDLGMTSEQVISALEIKPSADTQILEVSYKNADRTLSKDTLVAIINEFIKETKEIIPNGRVKVVESPELPENPVSPNKKQNIAIAILAGLMIGSGVALLKEYINDTLKSKEQTEKIIEIPVIGMIPCGEEN
jgi:capsular polysaccharide biosynthesis protein